MRLLILGAGAIGGSFGAWLAEAGVDVTFLVRPARAATLARDGLVLRSPLGNLIRKVAVTFEARPGFDAVMLTCKAYDLSSAIETINPAIRPGTVLLPLLNGLRHLDVLDMRFGRDAVLGGLCHIGATLTPDGTVLHLNRLRHLALGARTSAQLPTARALHETLARGGFAPVLQDDILQAMWDKFVLLAAYAGMTCLMRASVGAIVATPEGAALMREALAECAGVAGAAGHPPAAAFLAETEAMLTEPGSPGTASMLRDLHAGARTEHEHILGDMLARENAAGVPTPLLRVALAHLQANELDRWGAAPPGQLRPPHSGALPSAAHQSMEIGSVHIGLIGGIGLGATQFYHRRLVAGFAARHTPLHLTIAHADVGQETANLLRDDRAAQAAIFAGHARQLAGAGAECVVIPSVAGHFCIKEFEPLSPLPPVNLLDAVAARVATQGYRRIGVIGTRTVMASRFYGRLPAVEIVPPPGAGLDLVHDAYIDIALTGEAGPEQRALFDEVGQRLVADHGCEAVMLGGTDLSLVYRSRPPPFPYIHCAEIHVEAIVQYAA
ncbi:2-dehydropantoate 2-reductase [Paracraurococcus ruber]|uniref:2-dehydropantoate 2-reductase n=1 Tax=Paracraurococcus ruber TaxID=77675 RepID=UPI001057AB76|nr:2-dehydropantoate 2-reductase [Paracraurococcus ruber]TDG33717.1 2-dehydropantoate 2-reductase [Paracraurococcus ruber]